MHTDTAPPLRFCTCCGATLDDDDRFCGHCGAARKPAVPAGNQQAATSLVPDRAADGPAVIAAATGDGARQPAVHPPQVPPNQSERAADAEVPPKPPEQSAGAPGRFEVVSHRGAVGIDQINNRAAAAVRRVLADVVVDWNRARLGTYNLLGAYNGLPVVARVRATGPHSAVIDLAPNPATSSQRLAAGATEAIKEALLDQGFAVIDEHGTVHGTALAPTPPEPSYSPPGRWNGLAIAPPEPSYSPPDRWNGLAIASFILGLVPVIPFAGSIVAIVLGAVAHNQIDPREERGSALAAWGIALGILTLIAWVAAAVAVAMAASNTSSSVGTFG